MRDFDKLLAQRRRRELYELPIMTSRGCPYGCSYCSVTQMFGRRVRQQSADKAFADICRYVDRGFRRFFFYEDNLTADRRRARALLERMEPMGVRFNAQVRVDFPWVDRSRRQVDSRLLRSMGRAGADVLYIGYETVDDQTAEDWHKGYRGDRPLRARLREDTHILHDNGFWIHGMFVMGPQHTESTTGDIVRFARDNRLESLQISILTPFPGTALFEEMRPHLLFTNYPGDWDFYDGTHCVYDHSRLGISAMQTSVFDAHRRFYRYVGPSLRRVRAVIRDSMRLGDKAALVWNQARMVRTTFRQWRDEIGSFLDTVRAKCPQCL